MNDSPVPRSDQPTTHTPLRSRLHPQVHSLVAELHRLQFSRGLSVEALARVSGVAPSTIRNWYLGASSPSLVLFECAMQALVPGKMEWNKDDTNHQSSTRGSSALPLT